MVIDEDAEFFSALDDADDSCDNLNFVDCDCKISLLFDFGTGVDVCNGSIFGFFACGRRIGLCAFIGELDRFFEVDGLFEAELGLRRCERRKGDDGGVFTESSFGSNESSISDDDDGGL